MRSIALRLLGAATAVLLAAASVQAAAVLCQKKSGAVYVRLAGCKKREKVLDLAQFGVGGPLTTCPPDAVLVGTTCVDTYEASVWQIPPGNTALVGKVRAGTVTLADLTAAGATQLSPSPSCSPSLPANFPKGGQWTPVLGSSPPAPGVYAVSIPGVAPSACLDWFQADQACLAAGKRLLTSREWQGAAAGTPDPGALPGPNDCNTSSGGPSNTGSRTSCKSSWGVFDMIGNVGEWVADWADPRNNCTDWTTQTGLPGGDYSCFGGAGTPSGPGTSANIPGALIRGGFWGYGTLAGVFTVFGGFNPSAADNGLGFRCAR
ncbi:MAG: hypothetical protein B6D46_03590 [Polyangiaceae bacterium UTPRO1]|jgi:hypothetical protein|nr:SUMF1/EgtB/PvdO family nonheme iron enzyme [Myxococcales bacterium]OQY68491.1 MAG: hypothetical protein B6D46_03590 [Polyangiaceae bacterium UTPRO1]